MQSGRLICEEYPMAKHTANKSTTGVPLGSLVRDRITGFSGIAIGRTEFGFGCIHIRVQAKGLTASGDPIPVQAFDDQRIEVVEPPTKRWPEPKKSPIRLGDLVRDTLTGAVGVATSRSISLDGRINIIIEQSGLTPEGEPKSPLYTNAERVEVIDKRELKASESSAAKSGGPMARGAIID